MTQYVFTLSSRMVAIASTCVVLLGILLFLLGVEIGKLWVGNASVARAPTATGYSTSVDAVAPAAATPSSDAVQAKAP